MAHAQKPDFVFLRNELFHSNWQGRQFSQLLAAEVYASAVVMLDTPFSEVVCRVLATHSIRQFPLHFPSLRHRVPSRFNWTLILDKPCSKVVWRVLATHSIRQFPLHFPSLHHRVPSRFNWILMLDTPCSKVVWRVLATHSIRQFPLHFPSLRHRVPTRFNWTLTLDTPCSEVVWRVLATDSIRQFPLHFPSLRHRVPSRFNWTLLQFQVAIYWDMTSYNLVKSHQCLKGKEGLKLQDADVKGKNSLCFCI